MFSTVLIANRGEIAVRVIRTCRELGIRTVAVYSEADRDALHVTMADEAYLIGAAAPRASYLAVDKILDVAERCGAGAIHPGYGFLAEQASFAEATRAAGLAFVGPPAEAIRTMGDKLSARAAALAAGAHVVPGTDDAVTSGDEVTAFGEAHGYPLAIKAMHGGGGRGMKLVRHASEAADALASARREAAASFGRDECYIERFLHRPRHVEVQVIADTDGTVIHLGDRDCSLQRRYQKLVEEAPAPQLPDPVRQRLHEAAIAVTSQVGYVNAGTIEMLVETQADGSVSTDTQPCFLEMNTRLQVEHPVTEMVTGIDLVAAQLRIAAGDGIGFTQGDVNQSGHAIEVRINAEDPARNFVPSPGMVSSVNAPAGPWVRWDASLATSGVIGADYDSLIAKLVVWGRDRAEAIARMRRALDEVAISGVPTTVEFHRQALRHDDFVAARHSTASVEHVWELDLTTTFDTASATHLDAAQRSTPPTQPTVVEVDGRRYEVVVHRAQAPAPTGRTPRRRQRSAGARSATGNHLTAPMQGTVVTIAVDDGATVEEGDTIVVLEAMKMEQAVRAHRAGVVTLSEVSVGDVVTAGAPLATIDDSSA